MNINTATAFILNNLFLVIAGGLVAAWLAWRLWQKVENTMAATRSWGDLVFWAVKMIVIVAVLFRVGAWIYGTVNAAVVAAVNSPSVQTSGAALVQLGAAADQLVGWDGSSPTSGIGADLVWDSAINGNIEMLDPAEAAPVEEAPAEAESAPVIEVMPTTLELKPLAQMFEAAQANIATSQPTNAPTGEYIVQGGDSLSKIAAKLGVDVRALCKANNLPDCNMLRRGQKLIVPAAGLPALQADLNRRVTEVVNAPRITKPQTVYYEPKRNQSYIPPTWKVIEEGEMSVGEPANMSTNGGEVFASFPTN